MKLSDYVAQFLAGQGIKHVFAVSGGASLHLIHSVATTPGIHFVCPQHEQAGAMAADGYARATGGLGAAIATSGPGATNLITGICCSYYDSIPVLFLTGQVSTFRMKGKLGVRQVGFQETATVEMCRPITKYAAQVAEPSRIRYELEKACHLAQTGRPGPVLLDIPDNVQRAQIDPATLESFHPDPVDDKTKNLQRAVGACLELFSGCKRPVVILGWGVRLAHAEVELLEFLQLTGFPMAPTWAVADFLPSDHPQAIGTFGTHGTRHANFAVQNADLILALGSRLDTKATGSPVATFAREAHKIVVDIDPNELEKFAHFGLRVDKLIAADVKNFLRELNPFLRRQVRPDLAPWLARIRDWKTKYPICPATYEDEHDVNPYVFAKRLSEVIRPGEHIMVDTGCAVAWMMQAFEFKKGQRLYHDCNNTAMGWALPASIGASFALPGKTIFCVSGDGSLQMNIQELATVVRHSLPIKIFLLNNHGYSMIQQTQDQWLESKYLASSVEGGLAFPDFARVAQAYGFPSVSVQTNQELPGALRQALNTSGPFFCNVEIRPEHRVIPQTKFGRPNEDPEPLLNRDEFLSNMIVKPLDVSLSL